MMLNNSGVMDGVHEVAVEAQRGGSHHQQGLKKRPWTKEEDAILIEYVNKHGAGNWSEVPKFNSRLARSSRSCRLGWFNHLKPGLKKGPFSPEEEILIINLQAKHGNKWAYIASQLPGRTDNEIKNYWNTRMKHLQRAALPVYPHDHITSTFSSTSDHQNPNNNYSFQNHHHNSSSLYSNPMTQFHGNDGFAMPLFPVSSFGSSALLNESNIPNQTLIGPYNPHGGFGGYNNISLSPMIMGPPTYDPTPSVQGSNPELTSNQTPLSMNAGDKGQMGGSGYAANEDHYEIVPVQSQGYCGLLDDVLLEAQNIPTKKDKSGVSYSSGWSGKEKDVMVEEEDPVEEFDYECLVSLLNSPSTIPALSE